jgi:hypothetical protein
MIDHLHERLLSRCSHNLRRVAHYRGFKSANLEKRTGREECVGLTK